MARFGKVKKIHYKKLLSSSFIETISKTRSRSSYISAIKKNKFSVALVFFGCVLFVASVVNLLNIKIESYILDSSEQDIVQEDAINLAEAQVLGDQVELIRNNTNLKSSFKVVDKRVYILDEYYRSRNSPLVGEAIHFVEACDKYGAPRDCITTTAIARHETDLCKYIYSAEKRNCMGWGGAGPNRVTFNSFKEHIYRATDVLVNQYGIEYMIDPELMEDVFCGPQAECEGWGYRVKILMKELDDFAAGTGLGRLTDLR